VSRRRAGKISQRPVSTCTPLRCGKIDYFLGRILDRRIGRKKAQESQKNHFELIRVAR